VGDHHLSDEKHLYIYIYIKDIHHLDPNVQPTNQPDSPPRQPNICYSTRATVHATWPHATIRATTLALQCLSHFCYSDLVIFNILSYIFYYVARYSDSVIFAIVTHAIATVTRSFSTLHHMIQ
jgi:hypothetical protein